MRSLLTLIRFKPWKGDRPERRLTYSPSVQTLIFSQRLHDCNFNQSTLQCRDTHRPFMPMFLVTVNHKYIYPSITKLLKHMFSFTKEKLTNLDYKVKKISAFAELWECPITGQKALHATVAFQTGDIICSFGDRETLSQANYLTVQLNEHEHILLDPEFLQYINHSCTPNVFFDTTYKVVRCLKPIEVGEEMSFFYPSTEWSMAQGFDCVCKTEGCLGRIQGAAHLHPDILKNYQLSAYIQQKLSQ